MSTEMSTAPIIEPTPAALSAVDEAPLAPAVLDYHPEHLRYTLMRDESVRTEHPRDLDGDPAPAVGVHAVHRLSETALREPGENHGVLMWHECALADWTGTRADFSAASRAERARALAVGPAYANSRWGTHLGATMAVVTADDQVVFRSRAGKYAEAHAYDSLAAGTMLLSTFHADTDSYLHHLLAKVGLTRDLLAEFHPTHLAMRGSDFGLWVGGWVRTTLDRRDTERRARDTGISTLSVPLDEAVDFPVTEWGRVDHAAALAHASGRIAFPIDFLP